MTPAAARCLECQRPIGEDPDATGLYCSPCGLEALDYALEMVGAPREAQETPEQDT